MKKRTKSKSHMTKEEFKTLRISLGITQKEFGEHVGVTPISVYKWEKGGVPLPKYAGLCLESWDDSMWRLRLDRISLDLWELRQYLERKEES